MLDPENRGYIMREDLEKAIMEVGEPFTKEEVSDMMAVACDTETGKINYEHYINLLIVRRNLFLFYVPYIFISRYGPVMSANPLSPSFINYFINIPKTKFVDKNPRRH